MQRLLTYLFFLTLSALGSPASEAQGPKPDPAEPAVSGQVLWPNGQPVQDAQVVCTSDEAGVYRSFCKLLLAKCVNQ